VPPGCVLAMPGNAKNSCCRVSIGTPKLNGYELIPGETPVILSCSAVKSGRLPSTDFLYHNVSMIVTMTYLSFVTPSCTATRNQHPCSFSQFSDWMLLPF